MCNQRVCKFLYMYKFMRMSGVQGLASSPWTTKPYCSAEGELGALNRAALKLPSALLLVAEAQWQSNRTPCLVKTCEKHRHTCYCPCNYHPGFTFANARIFTDISTSCTSLRPRHALNKGSWHWWSKESAVSHSKTRSRLIIGRHGPTF